MSVICYANIATFPMAKTSAKELFEYYNQGLLGCLPMKDVTFLEVIKRRNLLPDEVKSSLEQMDKTTERSSYFLEKIIKRGFDNGDDSHFINLLAAMIESSHDNVKDLAIEILNKLGMPIMLYKIMSSIGVVSSYINNYNLKRKSVWL